MYIYITCVLLFGEVVNPHPQKNEEKCVSKGKNTTPKNKQNKSNKSKTNKPIASNLYIYKKRR